MPRKKIYFEDAAEVLDRITSSTMPRQTALNMYRLRSTRIAEGDHEQAEIILRGVRAYNNLNNLNNL